MDIAAMSISLNSTKLQMAVGVSMTKKVMDQQQIDAANLLKMMDQAAPPSEHIIDMQV
ncbi:MAG: YjfB family protein [Hungatella sp.]